MEEIIQKFNSKLIKLKTENDQLKLALHKSNIIAETRKQDIIHLTTKVAETKEALFVEIQKNEKLSSDIDNYHSVIDDLNFENSEMKIENSNIQKLKIELIKEQSRCKNFEEMMFLFLNNNKQCDNNKYNLFKSSSIGSHHFPPLPTTRSIQTSGVLLLDKYTQTL